MGLVYATIELTNGADETLAEEGYLQTDEVRKMPVTVLADSGAIRLTINEDVRVQLGLRIRDNTVVTLADGSSRTVPVLWPLKVVFGERHCLTEAFVLRRAAAGCGAHGYDGSGGHS